MTITPAAKAGIVVNVMAAGLTAIASGNAAARVHPKQEIPVAAAVLGNSGTDPAVVHPVPVTVARTNARTVVVRRRAKPALTAKARNVRPNVGPCPQQSRYRLFPKRNASWRCSIR